MNKKEFVDYQEVESFVQSLIDEKKWAIDIRQNTSTDVYIVCWIEHKSYISHDQQPYPDEIWTNQRGEMTCVQDLDPDHAKNILRMLLRNEREQRMIIQSALQQVVDSISEDQLEQPDEQVSTNSYTLH